MYNNYNKLTNVLTKLTKDEQGLVKRDLPKLFDVYSETTSVILPLDDDFISFSASVNDNCLVVQSTNSKQTMSKSQTSDILKLIATF